MDRQEYLRPIQTAPGRGLTVGTRFRVSAVTLGVIFAVFLGAPSALFPVIAQELTLIPDPDAAAACGPESEIALERVVRVRDSDADPWLGEDFFASTGPDGRIYATSFDGSPGVISVVDDAGNREATWGREGEGPGEGRWVRPPAFGPGDTAYAYDPLLGRVTLWTPEGVRADREGTATPSGFERPRIGKPHHVGSPEHTRGSRPPRTHLRS